MRVQEYNCDDCSAPFIRYNTIRRFCDEHQRARAALKQSKQRKPLPRAKKPIKQRGKRYDEWVEFRDKVARPYLDATFGRVCSVEGCNETEHLDVDHIKPRGSHPELTYELTNLRYLCRPHHIQRTGVPQWSNQLTPGIDKNAMRAELDAAAKAVREATA